jgi:hypothetical protein
MNPDWELLEEEVKVACNATHRGNSPEMIADYIKRQFAASYPESAPDVRRVGHDS